MEVLILKPGCKRKLPSGAEQSYPVAWSGDVPHEAAAGWIAEGKAERLAGASFSGLTAEETQVLKVAAQHALGIVAQHQANEADAGETIDPETGEIITSEDLDESGEGESEAAETDVDEALKLEDLTVTELRGLAKSRDIKNTSRMREAELIAALTAPPAA